MFQLNLRDGRQYNFINIQFADGYWVAWYYDDLTENFTGKVKEIIGEGGDGNV